MPQPIPCDMPVPDAEGGRCPEPAEVILAYINIGVTQGLCGGHFVLVCEAASGAGAEAPAGPGDPPGGPGEDLPEASPENAPTPPEASTPAPRGRKAASEPPAAPVESPA